MKSSLLVVMVLFLAWSRAAGEGADDANRAAPPESRSAEKPAALDPVERGAVKASEDQVLLPTLKGLVIATTEKEAVRLQAMGQAGVRIEGFSDEESRSLRLAAEQALGKEVSLRSLEVLGTALESALKLSGRPYMQATFPDQEITTGIVAIRIAQAKAGKILMAGRPAFGAGFSARTFRTHSGEALDEDVILEDLEWLNENPLRRASIAYTDGDEPDTLDLTLRVRSNRTWRAYGGIDNQLSDRLGDERVYLGFQHGDVFGLDHRLTTQLTSALDVERLTGISSSYEIPLPDRRLLELSGGYSEVDSPTAGLVDQTGRYARLAADYRVMLPRWQGVSHEWRVGLEFRDHQYDFPSGASQDVRFFQVALGWKGRSTDRFGSTRLDASLHYSPGHGILGSDDQDYLALGGSGAESLILNLEAERSWLLGEAGQLVGRLKAQWSDTSLLSSDQFAAAGANKVRGFDETKGYADQGMILSLEWQSPYLKSGMAGDFQGVAFVDAGFLDSHEGNDGSQLASVGVGLRWRLDDHLSARADLGIPVDDPDAQKADPRLHFSINTTW